ncbi:MAG: UDP-N-acetylmuramoyl-tripeptide--D-alanyl-D-alanine ligase [Bacteroidota bacterium]
MDISTLYNYFLDTTGVSTDTRKITKDCIFFALKGDNFDGNEFAESALEEGAKYAIIDNPNKNTNERLILVDNVLGALQDLATYHRRKLKIPIIALTGSNGKTTTKELINSVLSRKYRTSATLGNLNNHIGVPLTLLNIDESVDIGIVEMGANHQKEIEFLCNIAYPDFGLITNFGKAHLEGFGGIEGVIKGKSEMYQHLRKHDKTIFVNSNDELQLKQVGHYKDKIEFGKDVSLIEEEPFLKLSYNSMEIQTQITGSYNFNNICVAIALGNYFKVNRDDIIEGIETYAPKNNRSQVLQKKNLTIILDAYNANPTSMEAALRSFAKKKNDMLTAILGDMFELGNESKVEHRRIVELAMNLSLDKLIFVGQHFNEIRSDFPETLFFKTFMDLKDNFDTIKIPSGKLLIKGSRGMALERVLDLIESH